jgi:acetyl esterase
LLRRSADRGVSDDGSRPGAAVGVRQTRRGIIHDFVMVNALRDTHEASAAIAQAIATLTAALHPTA